VPISRPRGFFSTRPPRGLPEHLMPEANAEDRHPCVDGAAQILLAREYPRLTIRDARRRTGDDDGGESLQGRQLSAGTDIDVREAFRPEARDGADQVGEPAARLFHGGESARRRSGWQRGGSSRARASVPRLGAGCYRAAHHGRDDHHRRARRSLDDRADRAVRHRHRGADRRRQRPLRRPSSRTGPWASARPLPSPP